MKYPVNAVCNAHCMAVQKKNFCSSSSSQAARNAVSPVTIRSESSCASVSHCLQAISPCYHDSFEKVLTHGRYSLSADEVTRFKSHRLKCTSYP